MELRERSAGEVTVIAVTGDITLSKGGDVQLRDKVESLLLRGKKWLVLDLGGVVYVDSAGLGQLVQLQATTLRHGGSLKLLNLTKRMSDVLVVTRLSTVFDSYGSEAEVVASF